MASSRDSLGARLLESLKFWTVVAVLCAIVGTAAYYFGRDYVGEHLHEMEVHQRAPEIKPQSGPPTLADDEDTSANPPVQPVVSVRERDPSSREERRARRELEEPQDGAQLNAAEAEEDAAEGDDGDEQDDEDADVAEEQAADEGDDGDGYVVVAGSFADAANAQKQVDRLTERGYQPFISTNEQDGITYRRVNVGVFSTREEAEGVEEKLTSQGFDAAVWGEG
jgi:cell division septation protein DedD